jgi:predicted Fe-Mo cluster-binding NifX family protein
MKIAMIMDGNTLETSVSSEFDAGNFLLVVSRSESTVVAIETIGDLAPEKLAQRIIDLNCEGIITGNFQSQKAFDILSDACVTRYLGTGYSGMAALDLMNKRSLPLIRNFEGTEGCSGEHH